MLTTLTDVLNLLHLRRIGPVTFQGTQPDSPNHHIVGGQIAAQALMAASLTVPERAPHSLHVYFLRRGDARQFVDFAVTVLRDGGTFSARRITASQAGEVLMDGLASFSTGVDHISYQDMMANVSPPDALANTEQQCPPSTDKAPGWWVDQRAFDRRSVQPPTRLGHDEAAVPPTVKRIWLRARGVVPDDPVINSCVLTYLSALTLLESAAPTMAKAPAGTGVSALLDHAVWFARAADFSDWLYFDQKSPTGIAGRALATGTIYNRNGALVCTATQEGYFPIHREI